MTEKRSKTLEITFSIMVCLTPIALLNGALQPTVKKIGDIALILISLICFVQILLVLNRTPILKIHMLIICYVLLLLAINLFAMAALRQAIQIITIFSLSFTIKFVDINKIKYKLYFALLISVLLALYDNFGGLYFYGNTNKIGMIGFAFVLISVSTLRKKARCLNIILGLIVIFFSKARTPLLVCAIGFVLYLIMKAKSIKKLQIIWAISIVLMIVICYFYVKMQSFDFMLKINDIIAKFTQKNLYSGRNKIWSNIFNNFDYRKIILGYGMSFDVANLSGANMSAHNQYIQIIVQQGLIGLFVLTLVIYKVYMNTIKHGQKEMAPIILMIIIYNFFEVFLIQNHFAFSVIIWIIIFANAQKVSKASTNDLKVNFNKMQCVTENYAK